MVSAVIFDLDGTLLNTLDDLTDSVNVALIKNGYPERMKEEVRQFVGNGVQRLIKLAVPYGTSIDQEKTCFLDFKEHYNKNWNNKTKPYDGIETMIKTLVDKKIKIAVVSNKYDLAVKALIQEKFHGLIEESASIGERENIRKKPFPDSTLEALKVLKAVPETTVYVGDSDVDMETAENAGLFSVGVSWGFRERGVLEKAGAKKIVDSPCELLSFLLEK